MLVQGPGDQRRWPLPGLLALTLVLSACVGGKSIPEGTVHEGDVNLTAGGVEVGDRSTVNGSVSLRFGGVDIGEGATVRDGVEVSNGGLAIGAGARVASISVTRGGVSMGPGSVCLGDLEVSEGGIDLDGAEVRGTIHLTHGGLSIGDGSLVGEGIRVVTTSGSAADPTEIHIRSGARVEGEIYAEGNVALFIHEGAEVTAEIRGTEPVYK